MSKRFVYVLKDCGIPPRYYTGITSDVARRYAEHNAGSCIHTAKYRPWSIDLVLEFADEQRAVAFEALPQIRGRSRNDICDSLLIRDVTSADRVWNRAALESGGEAPKAGDRALAALLLMHGLVMNGGVQHALECVQPSELRAAVGKCQEFRV